MVCPRGHRRRARGRPRDPLRARRLFNPPLEVTLAFLTGYFAFLPVGDRRVRVLAVVTAGVYMGWHTPELTTGDTRLQGAGFWAIFNFLLNALLFGLVGLQLRPILEISTAGRGRSSSAMRRSSGRWSFSSGSSMARPSPTYPGGCPLAFASAILRPHGRSSRSSPGRACESRHARSGARDPVEHGSGAPFPDRSLIIFLAFSVVLATLVVQGLTLPASSGSSV